jgi:hypothetical protein
MSYAWFRKPRHWKVGTYQSEYATTLHTSLYTIFKVILNKVKIKVKVAP